MQVTDIGIQFYETSDDIESLLESKIKFYNLCTNIINIGHNQNEIRSGIEVYLSLPALKWN